MTTTSDTSRTLRLPFTLAPLTSRADLRDVLALRSLAYRRHYDEAFPALAALLLEPDDLDLSGQSTTLIARDKRTGQALGTVRLTSSRDFPVDWPQKTPELPCMQESYVYIDRLAVLDEPEIATAVSSACMRAMYLWGVLRECEWGLALCTVALTRVYRRRGAMLRLAPGQAVYLEGMTRALEVVGSRTQDVPGRLAAENPEYAMSFFDRVHPDILVDGPHIPWSEWHRRPATVPQSDRPRAEVVDLYTRARQLVTSVG